MKFVASGEEMSSAIKRVVSTVPKSTAYPVSIAFETSGESVSISVNLLNKRVSVRVPAFVVDAGVAAVDPDDVGMICGLDHDVTYETDPKLLTASNQKKRRSVALRDPDSLRQWGDRVYKPFGSIATPELMSAFKATDSARSADETRMVLTGFCLNSHEMVALDGFHFVLRKLNVENATTDENLILPAETYADMKNLIVNKKSGSVSVEYSGTRVCLSCDDFIYEIMRIEGEYIKYNQIIPKTFKKSMKASAKEMAGIAKEYMKYKSNYTHAMFLEIGGGVVTTSMSTDMGFVADKIESGADLQTEEDAPLYMFGMNIRYFADVLNAMDEDEITVKFGSPVSPAVFSTKETLAIILPLRLSGVGTEKFNIDGMLEFLKPMREALQFSA